MNRRAFLLGSAAVATAVVIPAARVLDFEAYMKGFLTMTEARAQMGYSACAVMMRMMEEDLALKRAGLMKPLIETMFAVYIKDSG